MCQVFMWGLLFFMTCAHATTVWHPLGFDVYEDGDTFNITMKSTGITLFQHTAESPMIFVGNGDVDLRRRRERFRFRSYLLERMALRHFRITSEMDKDHNDQKFIEFSNGDGIRVVIRLTSSEVHALDLKFVATPTHHKHLWLRMHAEIGEHVYGAGQQYSHFDLRGHNFDIWTRGKGTDRMEQQASKLLHSAADDTLRYHDQTAYPQSTFVSSQKYLCHFHGQNYINFDFTHDTFHEIFIHGDPPGMSCDARETWKHLMQRMTFFLERPQTMPDWINDGVILGIRGGTQRVLEILTNAQRSGVQVTAVLLEEWLGEVDAVTGKRTFWNWEWNEKRFPDLQATVTSLRNQGIRVFGYMSPHFSVDSQLFRFASNHGYLVKNTSNQVYEVDVDGTATGLLDLTNPEAYTWLKDLITSHLVDLGLGGWMADLGQYAPVDGVYHSQEDTEIIHNKYPLLWAMVNRVAVDRGAVEGEGVLGDAIFFTHSGTAFTSKYTLLNWAGPQTVDFSGTEGLGSVVKAALSAGMTGMGLTHFDIGGYTSFRGQYSHHNSHITVNLTRTEELLLRSAELAAFTPVMRTTEGTLFTDNAQFYSSDSTLQTFGRITQWYKKLKPYRLRVQHLSRREGLLMQRPLFFHFGDDEATYDIDDQYFFGPDLMVAPVLAQGAMDRRVYLPASTWRHVFTGETFIGPKWVTVEAPIGSPPVFFLEHSDYAHIFRSLNSNAESLGSCDAKSEQCSSKMPPVR